MHIAWIAARRLLMFVAVIWVASTLNFFVPRLAPGNPIEEKMLAQEEYGGSSVDMQALVRRITPSSASISRCSGNTSPT